MLEFAGQYYWFCAVWVLLPCISTRKLNLGAVTLFSMEFSITVEVIQLITRVGCCDVDDVILNTLGGMLGYLCYWIWRKYKHESEK